MISTIQLMIVLFQSMLFATGHKHYVSITEMEWNKDTQQIEATIQITGHDFEYALSKFNNSELELPKVTVNKQNRFLIATNNYFKYKFNLKVSDKIYFPNVIGIETKNDGNAFIYIIFNFQKRFPHNFKIENSVLMDYFYAQQNIIHFKYNNEKYTLTFTKNQRVKEVNLQ